MLSRIPTSDRTQISITPDAESLLASIEHVQREAILLTAAHLAHADGRDHIIQADIFRASDRFLLRPKRLSFEEDSLPENYWRVFWRRIRIVGSSVLLGLSPTISLHSPTFGTFALVSGILLTAIHIVHPNPKG